MIYFASNTKSVICVLCILSCLASGCEKDAVELSKLPESVIKMHLVGKWELCYSYGGIGGLRQIQEYPSGTTIVFKFEATDSVFSYWRDTLVSRSAVKWKIVDNYDGLGQRTIIQMPHSVLAEIHRDSLHTALAFISDANTAVWSRK